MIEWLANGIGQASGKRSGISLRLTEYLCLILKEAVSRRQYITGEANVILWKYLYLKKL